MINKKKREYSTGDIIPIEEGKLKDLIKHISDSVHSAHTGIIVAQEHYHLKVQELFDVLQEVYPELSNHNLRYNHLEGFIMVMGPKRELPEMSKYFKKDQN